MGLATDALKDLGAAALNQVQSILESLFVAIGRIGQTVCPVLSREIANLYTRNVTLGAAQLSRTPTIKIERQVCGKLWTRNAVDAGPRDRQLPGRPPTKLVLTCTDQWT